MVGFDSVAALDESQQGKSASEEFVSVMSRM